MAKTKRKRRGAKRPHDRRIGEEIWRDNTGWKVVAGKLVPQPGRPPRTKPLFMWVAEKLPYESLRAVQNHLRDHNEHLEGVYMAHDSMGFARYGGRGRIFSRLRSHRRRYRRELVYYSFYIVKDKKHERELETAILRAAGPQMILNKRKVRGNIDPGSVNDYEPGTQFFQRNKGKRRKRGKRKGKKGGTKK